MEDFHTQWSHRWINPKANSYESPIEGLGVICKKLISKGEIVCVYGGVAIPKRDIEAYRKNMGHAGIQVNDSFFLCPTSRDELKKTGIFNHSCSPNCGFRDTITLIALRDIKAGEELTFDYAFCESAHMNFTCNCKTKHCRKTITDQDWKNKDLQKKYVQYFSPYLQNKIQNQKVNKKQKKNSL